MAAQVNKQTDAERIAEALPRLYGQVARQRLMGLLSPDIVSAGDIESDGTRVKRTRRLLFESAHAIPTHLHIEKDDPRSYHGMWKVRTFDERSEDMGSPPEYLARKVFKDVEMLLLGKGYGGYGGYSGNFYHEEECSSKVSNLLAAGWKNIEDLTNRDAIYIWWHRDEFVFDNGVAWAGGGTYKTVLIKRLYDDYLAATTRAVVDVYIKYEMRHLLAEDIGVSELPKDSTSGLEVPVFSHHETLLCPKKFAVAQAQYKKVLHYAQNLVTAASKQAEVIESHGGYKGYIESLRRRAINKLIEDAPLYAVKSERDEQKSNSFYTSKETFDYVLAAKFVLEHLGAFEYERLYPEGVFEDLLQGPPEEAAKDDILGVLHGDATQIFLDLY